MNAPFKIKRSEKTEKLNFVYNVQIIYNQFHFGGISFNVPQLGLLTIEPDFPFAWDLSY